jgi:hypothetical protein
VGYIQSPFYQLAPFSASGAYYTNNTIQKLNFTRPYPIFGAITENLINGGKFCYNVIKRIYNHRTSFGLTLNVNYNHFKSDFGGGIR